MATYREDDALQIINTFKFNFEKWIISVGMISEGTNIPRLRVCCHLTRVKTELHFRQVLGRILRSSNEVNGEGFLFMPAEPNLIEYASRIAQEIPDCTAIRVETMSISNDLNSDAIQLDNENDSRNEVVLTIDCSSSYESVLDNDLKNTGDYSSLAKSYESTVNISGRFKQELLSLPLNAC